PAHGGADLDRPAEPVGEAAGPAGRALAAGAAELVAALGLALAAVQSGLPAGGGRGHGTAALGRAAAAQLHLSAGARAAGRGRSAESVRRVAAARWLAASGQPGCHLAGGGDDDADRRAGDSLLHPAWSR